MTDTPQPAEKSKLRWFQYRLWHLFALVTLAAIACSWFTCKMLAANRQREAVEAIEGLDGVVTYDYEFDVNGDDILNAEPPGPAWFRNLVGVDFVSDVVEVYLRGTRVIDTELEQLRKITNLKRLYLIQTQVSDVGLEHIKGLTQLEYLCLDGTQITDAGLEHLRRLRKLAELQLIDTQVTDAGLKYFEGLTGLEFLYLNGTQVTEGGVEKLQQALPDCDIVH